MKFLWLWCWTILCFVVEYSCNVSVWKKPLASEKWIGSLSPNTFWFYTVGNSFFSLEKPACSPQLIPESVAKCLYLDPDIRFVAKILSGSQLEKFYVQLASQYQESHQCPKLFVIHVQHGLGNRLRALASGLAYVELIPHIPILVWERDSHMGAYWEDLFEDLNCVIVSEVDAVFWEPLFRGNFYWIDYMKVDPKERYPLSLDYAISQHIYWKSAYILKTVSNQSNTRRHFHRLFKFQFSKLIPLPSLKQVVSRSCPTSRSGPLVGFHIRRRLLQEETFVTENPSLEYGESFARIINKHRKDNKVNYFCNAAVTLLSSYSTLTTYIAADSFLSYERWGHCVRNRIAVTSQRMLPPNIPNCENRSRYCIQMALVDLCCLSRCNVLFGSFYSSFTEVAHYWSTNNQSLFYLGKNEFSKNGNFRNEAEFLISLKKHLD